MGRNRLIDYDQVCKDYQETGLTQQQIADKYRVTRSCIQRALRSAGVFKSDEAYIPTPATYEDELKARAYFKAQKEKSLDPAVLSEKPVVKEEPKEEPIKEPKEERPFTITSMTVTGKYLKAVYEEDALDIKLFKADPADIIPASLEVAQLARYLQRMGVGKNALDGN